MATTVKPASFTGGTVSAASSSPATLAVPAPGRYEIDTGRSAGIFSTRHLFGLALVCGGFAIRAGTVEVAEPVTDSRQSSIGCAVPWPGATRSNAVAGACQGRGRGVSGRVPIVVA